MAGAASGWDGAGLYFHVPFCAHVCPYCDFAVQTGGTSRRSQYVDHLLKELALPCSWRHDVAIDTVYFGGGTPSQLEPDALNKILAAARLHLPVLSDSWTFLEANPEDISPRILEDWRQLGVRTLSLGVQAFDDESLRFLGRHHDRQQALRSIREAKAAGFDTVSVDLIYGLPGDHLDRWRANLDDALAAEPDHLSCYQLTIHEGTAFGRRLLGGQLAELPDPRQAEMFVFTHSFLREHGWMPYEVSNFARSAEHRSRHNQKYWRRLPYLGLGPSAHSFRGNERWWNERKLARYEERIDRGERPIAGLETIGVREAALEEVMLGLRTSDGIDLVSLGARLGVDLHSLNADLLARLATEKLVHDRSDRMTLTDQGLAMADTIVAQLVLNREPSAPLGEGPRRP
jgi:oxygen-independent coproporphyrinogen-3 oxidase